MLKLIYTHVFISQSSPSYWHCTTKSSTVNPSADFSSTDKLAMDSVNCCWTLNCFVVSRRSEYWLPANGLAATKWGSLDDLVGVVVVVVEVSGVIIKVLSAQLEATDIDTVDWQNAADDDEEELHRQQQSTDDISHSCCCCSVDVVSPTDLLSNTFTSQFSAIPDSWTLLHYVIKVQLLSLTPEPTNFLCFLLRFRNYSDQIFRTLFLKIQFWQSIWIRDVHLCLRVFNSRANQLN